MENNEHTILITLISRQKQKQRTSCDMPAFLILNMNIFKLYLDSHFCMTLTTTDANRGNIFNKNI